MHYNVGADLLTYVAPASLPVFAVRNGFIEAPTAPGIGFDIDEDKVRKADELAPKKKLLGDEPPVKVWRNARFTGPDGALREW